MSKKAHIKRPHKFSLDHVAEFARQTGPPRVLTEKEMQNALRASSKRYKRYKAIKGRIESKLTSRSNIAAIEDFLWRKP